MTRSGLAARPRGTLARGWTLSATSPLLAPLAVPAFRLAWLGRVAAVFGDQFQLVALAVIALDATGRSSGWGLVLLVRAVPQALLMLAGGLASDRLSPRVVVVGARIVVGGGVALAVAGAMPSAWAAAPWVALSGASQAAAAVIFFSLVQTRAPADARGRVVALHMLGLFGVAPLSYAIAALVGDLLGPRAIVPFGGGSIVLCGALMLARREMREVP